MQNRNYCNQLSIKNRKIRPIVPNLKRCPKCGDTKEGGLFFNNLRNKDGLGNWCKICHSKQSRKWEKNNRNALHKSAVKNWARNKENPVFMAKKRIQEKALKDKDRKNWNKKHMEWYYIDQFSKKFKIKKNQLPAEMIELTLTIAQIKRTIRENGGIKNGTYRT